MQKWNIYKLAVILIFSISGSACRQDIVLIKTTHLKNFPSASSIEIYKKRLYIVGDDAASILVTDTEHRIVDSISVLKSKVYRISKEEKADLESSIILNKETRTFLVAFSSFSTVNRNKILFLDLHNKHVTIKSSGLGKSFKELNIEGAAIVNDKLLLSNRANNTQSTNSFIITNSDIENGIKQEVMKTIHIILPPSKAVIGISGIAYLKETDLLLFTASTENTPNAYSDGIIGDSYIGVIKNISALLDQKEIKVDKLISLSRYIGRGKPQKIESIAVQELKEDQIIFHLAADNDNGESTLFKMKASF